jgi:hypothetical protein
MHIIFNSNILQLLYEKQITLGIEAEIEQMHQFKAEEGWMKPNSFSTFKVQENNM